MKKFLTAVCCLLALFTKAQINSSSQWTWLKGDSIRNQLGLYGTQGVADAANKPGGRDGGVKWTDASGNLWLFGGNGYPASSVGSLSDLWKYNIATNEWVYLKGTSVRNRWGVYGTQGISDVANYPGARYNSASWVDTSGNLWLFGGNGYPKITYSAGRLNDLWKYNIATNEWTWVKGDDYAFQPGVYGTQGIANVANKPGSRDLSISWTDANGNFWLFGGYGYDENGLLSYLSDLWKYSPSTNEWTWIKGDKVGYSNGNYGTQGIAVASNNPGSRRDGTGWTDASGNLWLFGGTGYDCCSAQGHLNDLWKYDVTANLWTWMKGDNNVYPTGVYGTQGTANIANNPGGRTGSTSWKDGTGNFFIFGGNGLDTSFGSGSLNDLWKYQPATNEWTWVKGDVSRNRSSINGTRGTADAANKPGGRSKPLNWLDNSGNFWLFGGSGYDVDSLPGKLNDLWKLSVSLMTLPLHLLEFSGRLQNNSTFLNWKTENEQNTSHFDIERSTDGRNYTAIGNVTAINQSGLQTYNYTDNTIAALGVQVIYYRLKQIDIDGKFTYSKIIVLSVDNSRNIVLLYPNPTINELNLSVSINKADKVQGRIIDNLGRVIKQLQWNLAAGSTSLTIDVSTLAKGMYYLELKGKNTSERKQFLKQ